MILDRILKHRRVSPGAAHFPTANVILATNKYGAYCIPAAAAHRPAAECVIAGRVWEHNTLEFMIAHAAMGDVITAGAFFGDALPGLSRATAHTVWAFEPNPENYRCSSITMLLNDLKNVRLQNAALGERSEIRQLIVRDFSGRALGGASQIADVINDDGKRGAESVPVTIVAIDQTIPAGSRIGLIQLDVEGFEEAALAGAARTIERDRPFLLLESVPRPDSKAGQLLESLGYRVARTLDEQVVLLECAAVRKQPP